MVIFSVETSCDETACAVVENGVSVLSSVIASSKDFHESTGGIIPEIAARKQLEFIVPVIEQTMEKFGKAPSAIDALAVTTGPGLIGSLLVGVEAAKALSLSWNKPLIPVNHLIGHIYANFVNNPEPPQFPAIACVVSGGHTDFVLIQDHKKIEYLGGTLDDAAGESFDKTARLLGLSKYLGGVELSKLAASCTVNKAAGVLPRPLIDKGGFDVSFSGLKTAVKNVIQSGVYDNASIACEFETAVVDVIENRLKRALMKYRPKSLLLGGGVAANTHLRTRLTALAESLNVRFMSPALNLCTDNAIYIASAAYFTGDSKELSQVKANPSLSIMDTA